jgi:hypothetical protein
MSQPYWIYDNHHRNRGRIHRGECSECNFGRGKNGANKRALDRWLGFETREEAYAAAIKLNRDDMKPCSKCLPDE